MPDAVVVGDAAPISDTARTTRTAPPRSRVRTRPGRLPRRPMARAAGTTSPTTHRTSPQAAAVVPTARGSRAPWVRMRTRTFLVLIAALLSVSLIVILVLNTVLAKGSFARYELVTRNSQLGVREQDLSQQVASLESPFELEKRARELGMVPAPTPVYIDLATGQVLGDAASASQPDFTQAPPATDYIDVTDGTGPVAGSSASPTPADTSVVPGGETPLGLRDGAVNQ